MIVSKTPLRISFFSGGSDIPDFYKKEKGAALSATINKYVYVIMHHTPYTGIKLMYDQIEEFSDVDTMNHAITKESLKFYDIKGKYTFASITDIVASGSGLGSSSAFTVGLVNCLAHRDEVQRYSLYSREYLAQTAFDIERNKCGYPVGKQDQYAAAYGGINLFEFNSDESVEIKMLTAGRNTWDDLQDRLLLVYSGYGRDGNKILQKQAKAMKEKDKFNLVARSRDKAYTGMKMLEQGKLDDFGNLLHEAWMDKKAVTEEISSCYYDIVYQKAIDNGALGGKLLGAGGGGFFLFYVPPKVRNDVVESLVTGTSCRIYDFKFTDSGTRLTSNC